MADSSNDLVVRLTTHPITTWVIRNVASRLDPVIFKATGGRLTSFGPPAMPMVTITMTGRRSGKRRSVHLACLEHEGDWLVVASAMGQRKHPGWSYNLEANPEVELQLQGERFRARARVLSEVEKTGIWEQVRAAIPQMDVYETRTDRNIKVFRLSRAEENEG